MQRQIYKFKTEQQNKRLFIMGLNQPALRLLDQLPSEAVAVGYGLPYWETVNKFGYNDGLQNGTAETIWEEGGVLSILQTGENINFASTSANDVNGGSGAHGLVIYGIDENQLQVLEVVFLNGTTPVATTNKYIGINRTALFRSGSSQGNEGVIRGTAATAGTVQAHLPILQGTTQQAFYFVGSNTKFLVSWLFLNAVKTSGGSSPVIEIKGYVFSFVSNSVYEIFRYNIDVSIEESIQLTPAEPFIVDEKSVLFFEATSDQNNTVVRIRFSGKTYTTND